MDERDLTAILAILGEPTVPVKVEREYRVRREMLHRSGAPGPLGPLGVVDLMRSLGYSCRPRKPDADSINWREQPRGTAVDVLVGDVWRRGESCGLGGAGLLYVRRNDTSVVEEVRRVNVRLAGEEELVD